MTLTGIDIDVVHIPMDATGHDREPVCLLCSATLGREGETAGCDVNSGGRVGAIFYITKSTASVSKTRKMIREVCSQHFNSSLRWRLSFLYRSNFFQNKSK